MKITPPSAWSPGVRALVGFGALGVFFVLVLAARSRFLGPYVVSRPASTWLLFALFVGAVALAGRGLRLGRGAAMGLALPWAVALVVATANAPLPHEMRAFALALPHPDGALAAEASVPRPFAAGHPVGVVAFTYAEGREARGLTEETVTAFEAAGWRVSGVTRPGDADAGAAATFGYVEAEKWGFRASCYLGRSEPSLRCRVNV